MGITHKGLLQAESGILQKDGSFAGYTGLLFYRRPARFSTSATLWAIA